MKKLCIYRITVALMGALMLSACAEKETGIPIFDAGKPIALEVFVSGGNTRVEAAEAEFTPRDTTVYKRSGKVLYEARLEKAESIMRAAPTSPLSSLTNIKSRLLVFDLNGVNAAGESTTPSAPSYDNYVGCYPITGTAVETPYDDEGNPQVSGLTLITGHEYLFVAYSYGTANISDSFNPAGGMSEAEFTAITNGFAVDPNNGDVLFFRVQKRINSFDASVTVTFRHVFSQLIVRMSGRNLPGGDRLTDVANSKLLSSHNGVLQLLPSTGNLTTPTGSTSTDFDLTFTPPSEGDLWESTPIVVYCTGTSNKIQLDYTTDMSVGGVYYRELAYTLPGDLPGGSTYYITLTPNMIPNGMPVSPSYAPGGLLVFLPYNLGANTNMTAKQQMAYPNVDEYDATVMGDLYQWGRKAGGHEKRTCSLMSSTQISDISTDTGTAFITTVSNNNNWVASSVGQGIRNSLWGNGLVISGQPATLPPATYKTSNDPCPQGYRVSTEHEWALIVNGGGSSFANISGDYLSFSSSVSIIYPPNNPHIVWVRVAKGKLGDDSWTTTGNGGYAIYDKAVWDAATDYHDLGDDLTVLGAPEPLLYLPFAGWRGTTGIVYNVGNFGFYWSSVVEVYGGSYHLYLNSGSLNASDPHPRGYGMSVRCVAVD